MSPCCWHCNISPCAGESSEASDPGRRPRRQRRRRRVVLPGEVEREQHLRDPKRRRQGSRLQSSSAGAADVDMLTSMEALSAPPEDLDPPTEGPPVSHSACPLLSNLSSSLFPMLHKVTNGQPPEPSTLCETLRHSQAAWIKLMVASSTNRPIAMCTFRRAARLMSCTDNQPTLCIYLMLLPHAGGGSSKTCSCISASGKT